MYIYRLVLRIRADAAYSVFPLGEKFGCNPDTEGPELIQLAHSLGLNVSFNVSHFTHIEKFPMH